MYKTENFSKYIKHRDSKLNVINLLKYVELYLRFTQHCLVWQKATSTQCGLNSLWDQLISHYITIRYPCKMRIEFRNVCWPPKVTTGPHKREKKKSVFRRLNCNYTLTNIFNFYIVCEVLRTAGINLILRLFSINWEDGKHADTSSFPCLKPGKPPTCDASHCELFLSVNLLMWATKPSFIRCLACWALGQRGWFESVATGWCETKDSLVVPNANKKYIQKNTHTESGNFTFFFFFFFFF